VTHEGVETVHQPHGAPLPPTVPEKAKRRF
jgi:hypothetical protein